MAGIVLDVTALVIAVVLMVALMAVAIVMLVILMTAPVMVTAVQRAGLVMALLTAKVAVEPLAVAVQTVKIAPMIGHLTDPSVVILLGMSMLLIVQR